MKETSSRLACWSLMLPEYDFEIVHRRGSENANADFLSRIPVAEPHIESISITHHNNNTIANAGVRSPDENAKIIQDQKQDDFCNKVNQKLLNPQGDIGLPRGITMGRFQEQNDILYYKRVAAEDFD